MAFSPEYFKNVSAGVQSIAVTAATVIGGVWALWKFSALKTIQKAKLELEVQSLRRAIVDLEISYTPLKRVDNLRSTRFDTEPDQIQLYQVLVSVKNNGNDVAKLDLSAESLFLRKVNSALGGLGEGFQGVPYGYRPRGVSASPKELLVLPGNKQVIPYLVEAEVEWIYQFEFSTPAPTVGAGQIKTPVVNMAGRTVHDGGPTWSVSTFVVVKRRA